MWFTKHYVCTHPFRGNRNPFKKQAPKLLKLNLKFIRVERQCNKEVTYNGIKIKKGMVVNVPAFALHYDKEYYPEPNRFNPDR